MSSELFCREKNGACNYIGLPDLVHFGNENDDGKKSSKWLFSLHSQKWLGAFEKC